MAALRQRTGREAGVVERAIREAASFGWRRSTPPGVRPWSDRARGSRTGSR